MKATYPHQFTCERIVLFAILILLQSISFCPAAGPQADFRPPAGERFALRGPDGSSILPGGRVIQPLGQQLPTGPGPIGMVVSANGKLLVTANLGPQQSSLTVLRHDRAGTWTVQNFLAKPLPDEVRNPHSVFTGIAQANSKQVWVSEGESGAVCLKDLETGRTRKILSLNSAAVSNSFSGDLALDAEKNVLYVLDQAHFRVVAFDTLRDERISEMSTGDLPYAISLSPDGHRAWVAEAGSICALDLTRPEQLRVVGSIAHTSNGPSGVLATAKAVYLSRARDDEIDVIDPETLAVRTTIRLRIPGLETLRGILPLGLAFDEPHVRLLVAEAGINAVGVIDLKENRLIGHLPAGWFPVTVAVRDGEIFVSNAEGRGTGASSVVFQPDYTEFGNVFRRGSVSVFRMPGEDELARSTQLVFTANGLSPVRAQSPLRLPVHYVVVIVKGNRTFDEVLGDLAVPGAKVEGTPRLARFGASGYADGGKTRFSLHNVNVTPNHHALARQFAVSDNFYADSDLSLNPNPWDNKDDPHSQNLWQQHLENNDVSFRNFDVTFSAAVPDQQRAATFISEMDRYAGTGEPLPHLLVIHLPNDRTAEPHPQNGYPYSASYMADNDIALGRIVEYLSHSPWWREMAVFVTENDARGGKDHVDAHRTILLGIGPYFKKGYVSHTNASLPSIIKTAFELLGVPPMNLDDATAADLMDMMTEQADYAYYSGLTTNPTLFNLEPMEPASR